MVCPQCSTSNPPENSTCVKCATPLPGSHDDERTVTSDPGASQWTAAMQAPREFGAAALTKGSVLAGRYEIVELLGEGGMGAVYKARDRELDRVLALKLIRPELAAQPGILRRFKQELILAREITHKNVVRIFDLGVAEGMKFITMELVAGQPLSAVMHERKKLPAREAAAIMRQVCLGLEAAHAEGVVHRDLKPPNIMVGARGEATVMDFGIAGSAEVSGLTRTGALIGTPAYMSPEQARGERVDARSDLFSFGVIFYELVTGVRPFDADTAMGMLLSRIQGKAKPPHAIDASVPRPVSDIIAKCLETDVERRYQTAAEVVQDLELWLEPERAQPVRRPPRRKWMAGVIGMAALALVAAGVSYWLRGRGSAGPRPVTLLVADFQNETSDPLFNGTLESAFSLALEGAPFLTTYDRADAHRIAAQLQAGAARMDERLARLVAARQGISVVVGGSIARHAKGYLASARALDAATGKVLASRQVEIANKESMLGAVGKLAAPVRRALGDATPESVQIQAAETFTSSSLDAAHAYALAQECGWKGQWDEAIRNYERAVQLEPGLGRAYAGLAVAYANQGLRVEAEKCYRLAMSHLDRMTDREKYRTRGGYYLAVRNHEKAVEEFTALVKQYPADSAGLGDLALAHFYGRDMARALTDGRRALEIYPDSVLKRLNVALYSMYSGDFAAAEQEIRRVLERTPGYPKAMLAVGLTQVVQGKMAEAAEIYRQLQQVPNHGPSLASIGLADWALYEGRVDDGVAALESGIAADLAAKRSSRAGVKLAALADAHLQAGRAQQAVAAADRAVQVSDYEAALFPAGRVYIEAGQEAKAAAIADRLAARLEPDPRAYSRLLRGEIHLKRGDAARAIESFLEAKSTADTWSGRLDLARAYLAAGKFTEAHSELELCIKRRGEAAALFLDDIPTYRYFPPVYYYLGRTQEALNSAGAAESYRKFLSLKQKSVQDALVRDARKRTGQ